MTAELARAIYDYLIPGWRQAPLVSGNRRLQCPFHDDRNTPNLHIHEGRGVWKCWAGCGSGGAADFARRRLGEDDARVLFRELGTDSGRYYERGHAPHTEHRQRENVADPKIIDRIERMRAATVSDEGTAARYLRIRGLSGAVPSALRLQPGLPYWQIEADGTSTCLGKYPAIVAEVRTLDGTVVALHRTYLAPGGRGKADVGEAKKLTPAIFTGATRGAAIHLAEPTDGHLALTEGIETGLAVMEAIGTPTWACVSAGGLADVELPPDVRTIGIWADHDRSSAGLVAAEQAAARLHAEGRVVRILLPDCTGDDWLDVLVRDGPAVLRQANKASPRWTPTQAREEKENGRMQSNQSIGKARDEWGPLVSLDHTRDLPALPVDVLSPWLREMANGLAHAYQVPPELPGMYALALVSGALAGRYGIEIRPGWRMPPVLYVVVALPPSERKSPVINALADPFRRWEREQAIAIADARRQALIAVEQARARADAALKALTRPRKDTAEDALAEAHRAAVNALAKAEAEVPAEARLIVEYATPEALAERMADRDDRQIILSDEGAGVFAMPGRYAKGGGNDLDLLLKGYDGVPYTPARITRKARPMTAALLALALGVQPAAIVNILRQTPEILERGLLARMLGFLPRPRVGSREIRATPVPQALAAEYNRRIRALLDVPDQYVDGLLTPRVLRFSREADDVIAGFEARLEPELGRGGSHERIAAAAGKLAGNAARIAAVLHAADHAGGEIPIEIPSSTAERGVRLAEASLPHTHALMDALAAPPELDGARRIADWLRRNGRAVVGDREILRATRGTVSLATAEQRDASMRLLEKHGYVRRPAGSTPRACRPSPEWEVHPNALTASGGSEERHGQNGQKPPDAPGREGSVHFVHPIAAIATAFDESPEALDV